MAKQNRFAIWAKQMRAPFLILAVVLVLIGIAAAHYNGNFHLIHSLLLIVGVVLTHISVNLFNEISDFYTKIDEETKKTPFSGGSGLMQKGITKPSQVKKVAYVSMFIAALIGFYFAYISGWFILLLMLFGAIAIRFYTSHLAKWLLGEFFAGLTLGSFVVMGSYYALTSQLNLSIILISIPPGILTFLLLFLNEFPDVEADKSGGRHHLVIHYGIKKSSYIYTFFMFLVYLFILITPFISNTPKTVLISFLTLPFAVKACFTAIKYGKNFKKLIPALGMNVIVVIFTDLLIAVGYFL